MSTAPPPSIWPGMAGGTIYRRLYSWRRSATVGSLLVILNIPQPLADRPDRGRRWVWFPR
jgi:hypothetical protein